MIERSFDLDLLLRLTDVPHIPTEKEVYVEWLQRPQNMMFKEGENIGLATYEYPGVYNVHWFYTVRGREAIDLGRRMLKNLFDNYGAQTLAAFVREDWKASRWACRQIGLRSHGLITNEKGEVNEFFTVTKEQHAEFLREKEKVNGRSR